MKALLGLFLAVQKSEKKLLTTLAVEVTGTSDVYSALAGWLENGG